MALRTGPATGGAVGLEGEGVLAGCDCRRGTPATTGHTMRRCDHGPVTPQLPAGVIQPESANIRRNHVKSL